MVTRHIGLAALSALALGASPALAQPAPAQRSLPVTGSAPQVCVMQQGRVQPGGLINFTGIDGDTLRFSQFTDPQTLATRAASATIAFEAVCNFPHSLKVESQNNGLWPIDGRQSATSPDFASAIPYRASVAWGQESGLLDATAKVRQLAQEVVTVGRPAAGDVRLRIEILQGASNVQVNAPVLAGTYADTLRIYLEPR